MNYLRFLYQRVWICVYFSWNKHWYLPGHELRIPEMRSRKIDTCFKIKHFIQDTVTLLLHLQKKKKELLIDLTE